MEQDEWVTIKSMKQASQTDKIKHLSSEGQSQQIIKVLKEQVYLDHIAESSDNLPNDFSTASLQKNEGQNLSAYKLNKFDGYRQQIMNILQKQNVLDLTTLKRILCEVQKMQGSIVSTAQMLDYLLGEDKGIAFYNAGQFILKS